MAKGYESELTVFLRSLKESRPQIEAKQREGRALAAGQLDFDRVWKNAAP